MSTVHFSRRSFLQGSAAGVGALALGLTVPAVFARETPAGSEKTLRWGVIGPGARGMKHLQVIKSSSGMEVLAVCDVMEGHLKKGLAAFPAAAGFSDYQKLLANPDINAVLITTPNCWHKEMVISALQAGKHVMCEKPMAVNLEECKAMRKAADAAPDKIVLYTMQLRYSPHFQAMRKQIEAGKIGKVRKLVLCEHRGDWNRGDVWQYTDPKSGKSMNWRFSHAASGGTLSEKVCHYFDILHWMVGVNPQSVTCTGGISVYNDGRDTWDHASTFLDYPGGVSAVHELCMFAPKRFDLEVIGETGALFGDESALFFEPKGKSQREPISVEDEIRHGERGPEKGLETATVRMYQDFVDCVKNKKQPWMDADKAMASAQTAWLGELSSDKKQMVNWGDLG
jgi:predicted dehydrogenase